MKSKSSTGNQRSAFSKKTIPFKGKEPITLTEKEAEVLYLLKVEFLTNKQVSIRRGITERRARQISQNLRRKGALDLKRNTYTEKQAPISDSGSFWRLHKLHFKVKPYYFYPRYSKVRLDLGGYGFNYRDWIITLHADCLEIREKSLHDFRSEDKFACLRKANDSFNRVIRELGSKYGFEVFKDKKCNIVLLDHHLAFTNSGFSNSVKEDYLSLHGFDSKVWFSVDKSKGVKEHEYIHSKRALSDSEIVEPFFNGLRDHYLKTGEVLTFESILMVINELAFQSKETATGLNSVVKLLQPKSFDEDLEGEKVNPDYMG